MIDANVSRQYVEETTLARHLATVDDLTVLAGIAWFVARRTERTDPLDEEDVCEKMRAIQGAVLRIAHVSDVPASCPENRE